MGNQIKVLKKVIRETVREMIKDEIVRMVAKGVFNEVVQEAFQDILSEYNTRVNPTSFVSPNPDPAGTMDFEAEPEYEKRPRVQPKKNEEEALKEMFMKAAYPSESAISKAAAHSPTAGRNMNPVNPHVIKEQNKTKPESTSNHVAPKINIEEAQHAEPSRLSGGDANAAELPEGDVNPAHILGITEQLKLKFK